MTRADCTLATLVVALAVATPFVRATWRTIDPGPADLLRACAAVRAREAVDPWGTAWVRTPTNPLGFARPTPEEGNLFDVRSAGRDRSFGTSDDLEFLWFEHRDPGKQQETWKHPAPEAAAWSYRACPAIPIALAFIVLLTRFASDGVGRRAGLVGKATVSCGLASLPTLLVLLALPLLGAWQPLFEARPLIGVLSPASAVVGSIYLLFAATIFAHRELHHLQVRERDDAPR